MVRRGFVKLGLLTATALFSVHSAKALIPASGIEIDGGPLGSLTLSGGVDGYGYYMGSANKGTKDHGVNVGSALIQLQKTSGVLQFTIEVGPNGGAIPLGTEPKQTTINQYSSGPLFVGYATIAPENSPLTLSAGQMPSIEGYEAGIDWYNPSQFTTDIFFVQPSVSRVVQANFRKGAVSAVVSFGDGYDTGVFNYLQGLLTYTFDPSNILNVYYGGNVGRTGLNAKTYGIPPCNYGELSDGCNMTVGGSPNVANSQMVGAYYSFTSGNLNLVPEVQYVWAKPNAQLANENWNGKFTANFGAALFANYSFGTSPYSLGGWVEYEKSVGTGYWYVGPQSEAVGFALSPTWQYKGLFARANAGYLYLLHNSVSGFNYGFGKSGTGKSQFLGTLEAGLLF